MTPQRPKLAVAIPCYNEAAAVATVVAAFRQALPDAEILVLDNNSTDGTGSIAESAGARVVRVMQQGKGHAVQRGFAELADADVILLVDGDGTYPAECASAMIAPILEGRADMVVGFRKPVAEVGAMTAVRGFGNVLIRSAFRMLIGPGQGDLLSGYRAFSRRFREQTRLVASGFEIETEIACQSVARGLRVVEVEVPYHPRIAGTESKLRAFGTAGGSWR
ncbi:MAG: glycosyltransferase [Isosphaeraceae bacterium]